MAYRNTRVEILRGNIESRIVGPTPRQLLDRTLTPNLFRPTEVGDLDQVAEADAGSLVYHPARNVFLSGALPQVKRALRRAGVRFKLRDARTRAPRVADWRLQGYELREYQRAVVDQALAAGRGLIDLGTGAGKTLLAAAIIAALGRPTLYVVTTRVLLEQAVDNLRDYLGVTPGTIGEGGRRPGDLTVALVQSLVHDRDLDAFRGGCLVFDEGHHAAAATWNQVIRAADPHWHYYLTAVPHRAGEDQLVLDALAGAPLTRGRYAASFLIEHGFASPVRVRIERVRIRGEMRELDFATLYRRFIVRNELRNMRLAALAMAQVDVGRSVLILVEHVEHGGALLRKLDRRAAFVHGRLPRHALHEMTRRFARGELKCLVATSGLFQEGVSIDGIHVLVQAGGLRSRAKVIQALGRGLRRAPGKAECLYVDFFDDDDAGVLREHSRARHAVLREQGFPVPAVEDIAPPATLLDAAPEPTWAPVPNSDRFVLVDGEGEIHGAARCLRRELVPDRFCKRCRQPSTCENGGRIEWHAPEPA